ncbi:hypothetical protein PF005_g26520 [Phytophthora fragariae]|uniref:Uncharacterized protein n=1 Tax=Phytophthora fragariae TaxID=53985 RepID=A0A6A3DQJ9_9STRA|nr:hypothetical protein PF009_g27006 [Phytophthora fragariae]KAE9172862.1 hypothetical protein PF005_g26520 [Phytophthora fragariae]KAE9227280.1 hypothetical protein PF004_g11399 [Phytophthora fragariae]
MGFADTALNLDDDVADVLTATLFMHFPDMLRLCEGSPFITKVRETLAELNIGESELLAWGVTITRAIVTPPATTASATDDVEEKHSPALVDLIKRQSEQIDVLILQNKRLDERMLAVESELRTLTKNPAADSACSDLSLTVAEQQSPLAAKATRSKKKGAQSLSAIWFEWFTAEPRLLEEH